MSACTLEGGWGGGGCSGLTTEHGYHIGIQHQIDFDELGAHLRPPAGDGLAGVIEMIRTTGSCSHRGTQGAGHRSVVLGVASLLLFLTRSFHSLRLVSSSSLSLLRLSSSAPRLLPVCSSHFIPPPTQLLSSSAPLLLSPLPATADAARLFQSAGSFGPEKIMLPAG